MKKLLVILILFNVTSNAQTIFEKNWTSDFSFFVSDVVIDGTGNAYFACSGFNANIDSSVSVVVKTDANFDIIWSNSYQTYRRDDLGSIEVLSDGNILLGGTMRQDFAFDIGGGLIKIDPDGGVIWKRVVPGSFDERVIYTHEESEGEIFSVIRYGVSGQPSSVILTTGGGNLLSDYRLFADGTGLQIEDVIYAGNNTYYATGEIFDSEIGYNVIFIAHFTNSEVLWFRKYDFGESTQANSIAINANNELAISGLIVDPESVFNGNNAVLLKTNSQGAISDAKRIFRQNNGFSEFTTGLTLRDDGSVVISFFFQSDTGGFSVFAEFTPDGSLNWISAIENGEGVSLSLQSELVDGRTLSAGSNFNGGIVLTAMISNPGEFACNNAPVEIDIEELNPKLIEGELDFSLQKVFVDDVDVEIIPWQMIENEVCSFTVSTKNQFEIPVRLFPIPVINQLNIEIPTGLTELEIYSTGGRKVVQTRVTEGLNRIDLSELPSGVYVIHLEGELGFSSERFTKL